MPTNIEAQGHTIDEAIQIALNQLGVSRDKVEIEILHHPRRGVFGIGARRAKVRATLRQGVMLDGDEFDMSDGSDLDDKPRRRRRRGGRQRGGREEGDRPESASESRPASGAGGSQRREREGDRPGDRRGGGRDPRREGDRRGGEGDGARAAEGQRPRDDRRGDGGRGGRGGGQGRGERPAEGQDRRRGGGQDRGAARAQDRSQDRAQDRPQQDRPFQEARSQGSPDDLRGQEATPDPRGSDRDGQRGDRQGRRGDSGRDRRGGRNREAEGRAPMASAEGFEGEAGESGQPGGSARSASSPERTRGEGRPPRTPYPAMPSDPADDAILGPIDPAELEAIRERAAEVVVGLLARMGFEAQVDSAVDADIGEAIVTVRSDSEGLLIGRRGQTLDALEHVVQRMATRGEAAGEGRVLLDIGEYRRRRRESLEELAGRLRSRAMAEGRSVQVSPMSPRDRRFFAAAFAGDEAVETRPLGAGFYRRMLVAPAGMGAAAAAMAEASGADAGPNESEGGSDGAPEGASESSGTTAGV